MVNLFGTSYPTLDASEANANAKISTAQFLTITNVKHPAVQEMLDFGEADFEFLSRDDYYDRRNSHIHAVLRESPISQIEDRRQYTILRYQVVATRCGDL